MNRRITRFEELSVEERAHWPSSKYILFCPVVACLADRVCLDSIKIENALHILGYLIEK